MFLAPPGRDGRWLMVDGRWSMVDGRQRMEVRSTSPTTIEPSAINHQPLAINHLGAPSAYQLQDLPEFSRSGLAEPLVDDHLGRGHNHAGAFHLAQADVAV